MTDSHQGREAGDALVARVAERIVSSGLEVPAVFFLELHRPFGTIFYHGALLLTPLAAPLFGIERMQHLQTLLADRQSIDRLLEAIEDYTVAKRRKTARIGRD